MKLFFLGHINYKLTKIVFREGANFERRYVTVWQTTEVSTKENETIIYNYPSAIEF